MADTNMLHTDEYFLLLKNLDDDVKLELISRLSDSIRKKHSEEKLRSLFCKLDTEKTADELIKEIRDARNFTREEISLWNIYLVITQF